MPTQPSYTSSWNTKILLRTTALGLVLCMMPIEVNAQSWGGSTDTDWFEVSNWLSGILPTTSNDVTVNSDSAGPVISGGSANSRFAYFGWTSNGSGIINSGGTLTSTIGGNIGFSADVTGSVLVTNIGSAWDISGNIRVGNSGTGILTISDGGTVSNVTGRIGENAGSNGTVTVTGSGSTWTNSANLVVGISGIGNISITNGGKVSNATGIAGYYAVGSGVISISGVGSLWTCLNGSTIGRFGTGTLAISEGGVLSTNEGNLAYWGGSEGIAIVSGIGSTWIASDLLRIGVYGEGTLTLSDSGTVSTTSAIIANSAGSTGTLNIGAAAGDAAVAAGTLDTPTVTFGSGTGKLVFNHTATEANPYLFAPDISGNGDIIAEHGYTWLTGDLSTYTGTTTVSTDAMLNIGSSYGGDLTINDGGTIAVNDTVSGAVTVNDGGTLKGSGTVGGVTVNDGGIVAPGNSIGTINIAGNVSFAAGSYLDVEVDADGNSDLTHASGTATITGGTVRLMPELATDTFALDNPYTILTADGGVVGTFTDVTFMNNALFLNAGLTYDANNVYATVSRNGVSFTSAAWSPNQYAMARALDTATTGAALLSVGQQSTVTEAREAMDRLSGEMHANIKGQLLEDGEAFAHVINGQNGSNDKKQKQWLVMYGAWKEASHPSIHGYETDKTGVAYGITEALNDNTEVGLALGYERTEHNLLIDDAENTGKSSYNSYRAALYANQAHDNWNLKASAQYGYNHIDTNRHVVFTGYDQHHKVDYGAHTFTAYTEGGYTHTISKNLSFEPYAGLTYGYGLVEDFEETGTAGLTAQSDGFHEGKGLLGIRMKQGITISTMPTMLTTDLSWKHRIGSTKPQATYSMDGAGTFANEGIHRYRDTLTFNVGMKMHLTNGAMLNLSYTTDQYRNSSSHYGQVGVKWRF